MRLLKFTFLALLILGSSLSARAFSLLGKSDVPWQLFRIGYNLPGDLGGPMNLGEEYRWNTPYITYGFDASFVEYFGSNGVAAVENAMGILNALPPMSQLSDQRLQDEYPFESIRANYLAGSLSLLDVKSTVLSVMIEELGLAEPERYVWTLASRTVTGTAPNESTNWFVIQRNFDPITYQPTPYINGKLYVYDSITETKINGNEVDYPNVITADPLAYPFASTVASGRGGARSSGTFYTGLTYDDVGGLRYLIRTNNYNVENLLPDVREVFTNTVPEFLITQDYCLFLERTQNTTNDPQTLLAFPGYGNLSITSTNISLGSIISTNYSTYVTNRNFTSELVAVTNYTTTVVTNYNYTFGNVVIYKTNSNRVFTNTVSTIRLAPVYSPQTGQLQTNIFTQIIVTNRSCGEFYIVPTNLLSFVEVTPILTNSVATTNFSFIPQSQLLVQEDRSEIKLLITDDLTTFSDRARTNDTATFLSFYPDLLILSTNRYFTNIVTTNYIFYFTNQPYDPAGSYSVASKAVPQTNVATNYNYIFANVVTNTYFTSGPVTIIVTKTVGDPYASADSVPNPQTTSTDIISNYVNGSIYILPTNLFGLNIVETQFVETVTYTNFVDYGTNFFQFTNTDFTAIVRYSTNYYYSYYPIYNLSSNSFVSNTFGIFTEVDSSSGSTYLQYRSVGLRQPAFTQGLRPGVDKLTFVRVEHDSFAGTNSYAAYTNQYIDTVIVSNAPIYQTVQRTSKQPDFLFTADDLRASDNSPITLSRTGTGAWQNNNGINAQASLNGPGVITPQVVITLSKIGPFQYNYHQGNTFFTGQSTFGNLFTWGSFDGTTNTPIVYPVGTTIPPDAGP